MKPDVSHKIKYDSDALQIIPTNDTISPYDLKLKTKPQSFGTSIQIV